MTKHSKTPLHVSLSFLETDESERACRKLLKLVGYKQKEIERLLIPASHEKLIGILVSIQQNISWIGKQKKPLTYTPLFLKLKPYLRDTNRFFRELLQSGSPNHPQTIDGWIYWAYDEQYMRVFEHIRRMCLKKQSGDEWYVAQYVLTTLLPAMEKYPHLLAETPQSVDIPGGKRTFQNLLDICKYLGEERSTFINQIMLAIGQRRLQEEESLTPQSMQVRRIGKISRMTSAPHESNEICLEAHVHRGVYTHYRKKHQGNIGKGNESDSSGSLLGFVTLMNHYMINQRYASRIQIEDFIINAFGTPLLRSSIDAERRQIFIQVIQELQLDIRF